MSTGTLFLNHCSAICVLASFSRRQLPQAPGSHSTGFVGGRGSIGSATSPVSAKPTVTSQSDSSPNIYKPVPAVPTLSSTGNSPGVDDIRDHLSRKPSTRPPGALAPRTPGFNSHYDENSLLDLYATADPLGSRPPHAHQLSGQLRFTDAYSHANTHSLPDNNINVPLNPRVKDIQPQHSPPPNDFINRKSLTRVPEPATLILLPSQDADVDVGRATSTGSTTSSARTDLLGRNTSATTTATTYSDYHAPKSGPSTLTRDTSVRSYAYSTDGPSTVGYPETYDDSPNGYGVQGASTDSFDRSRPSDYGAAGSPRGALPDQEDEDDEYFTDSDDPDPDRFVNFSLLSHLAVRLRDKVPRGTHVKSSIPYPRAFTGKDIVVCRHVLDAYYPDHNDLFEVDNPITNSARIAD